MTIVDTYIMIMMIIGRAPGTPAARHLAGCSRGAGQRRYD